MTFDDASAVIGEALGRLPENVAKLLRVWPERPIERSEFVRIWCRENPDQVALIVGALARLRAQQINREQHGFEARKENAG